MVNSPLKNMIPLQSYEDKIKIEFNYICEHVFDVTHCQCYKIIGNTYLNKGIEEVLRIFSFKFKPTRISEKAFVSNNFNKIKEELSQNDMLYKKWYDKRKKYYPLYLEHIIPIGSLIDRCQCCISKEEVENVLKELEFTIVLKEEDKILSKKGYNSKGRETLEKAEEVYKKCNIQLRKI